jgi:hypothetical protein
MRAIVAAALLAGGAAQAASLGGRLSYPSEGLPAMIVVARDAAGVTRFTETKAGQARYRIDVPAGTYVLYAVPVGIGKPPPGQVPPRGAYTEYTLCGRDKAALQAGRCRTGPLVEVRVADGDKRDDLDLDDWYLPDALAATLNVLSDAAPPVPQGVEALFAKYPINPDPPADAKAPDLNAAPAPVRAHGAAIQTAATRGPFFAGGVGIARWSCGRGCENWALVDLASGRIAWLDDPALQPLRADLPCDLEPIDSREDSRLLLIRRRDGANVIVQELLWSPQAQRLERGARSVQPAAKLCQ